MIPSPAAVFPASCGFRRRPSQYVEVWAPDFRTHCLGKQRGCVLKILLKKTKCQYGSRLFHQQCTLHVFEAVKRNCQEPHTVTSSWRQPLTHVHPTTGKFQRANILQAWCGSSQVFINSILWDFLLIWRGTKISPTSFKRNMRTDPWWAPTRWKTFRWPTMAQVGHSDL